MITHMKKAWELLFVPWHANGKLFGWIPSLGGVHSLTLGIQACYIKAQYESPCTKRPRRLIIPTLPPDFIFLFSEIHEHSCLLTQKSLSFLAGQVPSTAALQA